VPANLKHWGSAIFTKKAATRSIRISESLQGWIVGLELDLSELFHHQHQPLRIFSVHTPTRRENNNYPLQAQQVLEFLETQADAPLLVAGDFNVTISTRGQS
jgi:hypothetical protein